jgi:LysR family glycine cleavage system transcriptional activator
MSWQLPSLTALRIFEAAARHLSFTRAAQELNLTQSAVSRQIRQTEEYLGLMLFQRVKKRLVLTDAGQTYVRDIRAALEQMQTATVNLLAHKGKGGILRLATPPAFCTRWLIPRLSGFSARFPNIFINLSTHAKPFDFQTEPFDAAIYYGANDWPGAVVTEKLVGDELLVVCSASYFNAHRDTLQSASQIGRHVLLQQTSRQTCWTQWMDSRDVHDVNALAGPRFEHLYMVLQATLAGLGLGLLPRILIEDEVATGRLVAPYAGGFKSEEAYCLVYPESKRNESRLESFRTWIHEEAQRRIEAPSA